MVLILVPRDIKSEVTRAICEKSGLSKPGKGISFTLPIDEVEGIVHLINNEANDN